MLEREQRVLGLLGFAARARGLITGVPLVCEALKNQKKNTPLCVILANDASPNSKKRILDRTAFYKVPCYLPEIDRDALAHAIGKRDAAVSAVGVTDRHLAAAIMALWEEQA